MAAQNGHNHAAPQPVAGAQVVIVTGGADGFGAAIVDRFSREGCKVTFIDLSQAKGEEKARADLNLHFIRGDVTRRETWEEALQYCESTFGRVDVVVNNAGITYNPSAVHNKSIEEYQKVFDVNVKPIFLSAQVICPFMLKQGSGTFINITSTGSTRPRPGFAFYNASKAAVNVASRTMALEYAPTIRFNCICPAVGNTTIQARSDPQLSRMQQFARLQASTGNGAEAGEKLRKLEQIIPMGRITQPTDVANAAWFLGSEQSSFMTGTTIEVDGGRGV